MASSPRAVTLRDVAREAGVSVATASRALNGSSRHVDAAYRSRVIEAAQRLNYSVNVSAQAVVRGRNRSIGLVVLDIDNPFFSAIADGVFEAAADVGLEVSITSAQRRPERQIDIVAAMRGARPQVLIVAGTRVAGNGHDAKLSEQLRLFESEGGRVVLITQPGLDFDTVSLRNEDGARDLSKQLATLGYRKFAVLSGPINLLTAQQRLAGIRAGLEESGLTLPDSHIIFTPFTRDGGYAGAGELLNRALDADVVITANDIMAVGAMARFREAGIVIPDDLAIAGFDDIWIVRDVSPSLTTYSMSLEQLGRAAVELAVDPERTEARVRNVDGHVVLRQSTPPRR